MASDAVTKSDRETYRIYETLKAYSGEAVSAENIIGCIIYTMKLLSNTKLSNMEKKQSVISLVKTLIKECSIDESLNTMFNSKFISFVIESVYTEFRDKFKTTKWCCSH